MHFLKCKIFTYFAADGRHLFIEFSAFLQTIYKFCAMIPHSLLGLCVLHNSRLNKVDKTETVMQFYNQQTTA